MDLHKTEDFKLTTAEAIAKIKRAKTGSRFAVSIVADAPIAGDDSKVFLSCLHSYLSISKNEALRLAGSLLTESIENRGGRIPMRTSQYKNEPHLTYWIL
jgi:hypothetical protein